MEQGTAYLGLGSNLGDRAANLLQALAELTRRGLGIRTLSSIYETDPVGYLDQPAFLNMAAKIDCRGWDPWRLLRCCLETEEKLGRRREIPQGPRTIDIDLLLFDDWFVNGAVEGVELILPHPRMQARRFVLEPLCEIDPRILHPVLGVTVAELLDRLDDRAGVAIYH